MDAIKLLKQDHQKVSALFEKFEGLGDRAQKAKGAVVRQIIAELTVHAQVEETIFYPAAREAVPDAEDNLLEAYEEHHIVKRTLAELTKLSPEAENFDAKVTVLIESVRHHVKEEESELFPKIRKSLEKGELEALGARMEAAKNSIKKDVHAIA